MSSLSLHLLPLLCVIILVFNTILSKSVIVEGCQSCLFPPLQHRLHHQSHHHSVAGMAATTWKRHSTQLSSTTTAILYNNNGGGFCIVALRKLLQRFQGKQIMVTPFVVTATGMLISQRIRQSNIIFRSNEDEKEGNEQSEEESKEKTTSKPVTSAMVGTIGIYKNFISPLLPPACRFLPTCSQYGVQAIEEFGPSKGVVLTAWRIMRCTPFGGKGYDPPKWPPVPYNYGSY